MAALIAEAAAGHGPLRLQKLKPDGKFVSIAG